MDPCRRCPQTKENGECPEKYEDEVLCECNETTSSRIDNTDTNDRRIKPRKKYHKSKEDSSISQVSFSRAPDRQYNATTTKRGLRDPNLIPDSERRRPSLQDSAEESYETDSDSYDSRWVSTTSEASSVMFDPSGKNDSSEFYNSVKTKYRRKTIDTVKMIDADEIRDKLEPIRSTGHLESLDKDKTKFTRKSEKKGKTSEKDETMDKNDRRAATVNAESLGMEKTKLKRESADKLTRIDEPTNKTEVLEAGKTNFTRKTVDSEIMDKSEADIDKYEPHSSIERAESLVKVRSKSKLKTEDKGKALEYNESMEKTESAPLKDRTEIVHKDGKKYEGKTLEKVKSVDKVKNIEKHESIELKEKTEFSHKRVDKRQSAYKSMVKDGTPGKDDTILNKVDKSFVLDNEKTKMKPVTKDRSKTAIDETVDRGESTERDESLKREEILVQRKASDEGKSKHKGKNVDKDTPK